MSNEIGKVLRLTTFGESHGVALGGVLDGFPSRVKIDLQKIQDEVDRRRPGQSLLATQRKESDRVEILSGLLDGVTLGTPIAFIVRNSDQRSIDYEQIKNCYRPSHADYTWQVKYGIRDHRGGGRASARETVARVVAGAFARQLLEQEGVSISAYSSQIGGAKTEKHYTELNLSETYDNDVRCPDPEAAVLMRHEIEDARENCDTVGGVVTCVVRGLKAGVGEPVFGKLHSQLASAMMSIPAAKGFDYGLGFDFASRRGSEVLDEFEVRDGQIRTKTNYSGGIQGGISNGEDIYMRVAFKPIATLLRDVNTINSESDSVILHMTGRHDVCAVPRAVSVVEAMAALVILDGMLSGR